MVIETNQIEIEKIGKEMNRALVTCSTISCRETQVSRVPEGENKAGNIKY